MLVLLPAKFCYLGCPAALGEGGREQFIRKTLPVSAGIQRYHVNVPCVCSVPVQLNRDVLTAYMSAYGNVEKVAIRSTDGTAHGDLVLHICHDREGFQTDL